MTRHGKANCRITKTSRHRAACQPCPASGVPRAAASRAKSPELGRANRHRARGARGTGVLTSSLRPREARRLNSARLVDRRPRPRFATARAKRRARSARVPPACRDGVPRRHPVDVARPSERANVRTVSMLSEAARVGVKRSTPRLNPRFEGGREAKHPEVESPVRAARIQ
jgi:hypothetical protein